MGVAATARQFVGKSQSEAVTDVIVATGALESRACAVLWLLRAIEGNVVNGVRPGIAGHEVEALPGALRQRRLQSVVDRCVIVPEEIDKSEIGEARIERPTRLLAISTGNLRWRIRVHLVDVADAVQRDPAVAHITDLQ